MAAAPTETLRIDEREVVVTNPRKVLFPKPATPSSTSSATTLPSPKGRCAVPAGGPNVLVRYPDGIDGEFFFQKRAPKERPPWVEVVTIRFPSGRTRRGGRAARRRRPRLDGEPRVPRAASAPRPRDGPRSSRRAAHRSRPGPRCAVVAGARGGAVVQQALDDRALRLAEDLGQARAARARPHRAPMDHDQVRRAALALARDVERRAPELATSKWWKEERHGVFIDYNQNAKDRTVAGAYSVRPTPDARVSAPLEWSEVDDASPATSRSSRCRSGTQRRRPASRARCARVLAREPARALGAARARRPGRCAVAAAIREGARRAAAGPAVATRGREDRRRAEALRAARRIVIRAGAAGCPRYARTLRSSRCMTAMARRA